MKKVFTPVLLLVFWFLSIHVNSQIPVIVKDWATYMGNSEDSIFKTPLVNDSGNTYVGSFTINTNSGADILIAKYNDEGQPVWTQTWTGPGNGRDQASAIFVDDQSVYVTGITFTSVANNFDYVTLRLSKTTGTIAWVKTYNGTASIYDVATAITAIGKYVYVTGLANNLNTSIDYTTIKYAKTAGIELWNKSYDHFSLMDIPFGISIIENDTLVAVTGASQKNLTDWDYATIIYQNNGVERDTNWVSGTASGFDRAQAVKSDVLGNIYITGTISQSITGYDIKTVKIEPNGNVNWQGTYDNDSSVDEGVDLIVDAFQNVYVCGKSYDSNSNYDYMIRKYNSSGIVKWTKRLDLDGGTDEPKKMCFDSFGNIVVTGKGLSGESKSFDFFTAALDTGGIEIWRQTYGVVYMEDDQAQDLAADENGNIYVTGEVILVEHGNPQTVTIKYRSDYFTDPQQVDTPAVANYFYTNYGQIADENGNATDPEKLHYYTIHHSPQLYFQEGMMCMVFSHIDADTNTEDTLQRVDVSFWHGEPSKAFPVNEKETSGYYNYFLAHCPDGITDVYGNEKLLFENVYEGIDALYSSNSAGLKLYFICSANSDPTQIGLFFEGQDNLQVVSNWGLQVETSIGNYEFEKPRVYQITENGTVRQTNWQLSWAIPNPGQAMMSGWGEWGPTGTLVIEIGKPQNASPFLTSIKWATYIGGTLDDVSTSVCTNDIGYSTITGYTQSHPFINQTGFFTPTQASLKGISDAFIAQFKVGGELNWKTYYGGTGEEFAWDIAYDKVGADQRLYVVGSTSSQDLVFHATTATACYQQQIIAGVQGLIIELNSTNGQPIWVTSIGGDGTHFNACAIDQNHNMVAVGFDFSYTPGTPTCLPLQPGPGVTPYFPTCDPGNNEYFQYLPSNTSDPVSSPPFVKNDNGIIARFNKDGVLNYSTFFGGFGDDYLEDISIDNNGNLFIVGGTFSDYPTCSSCEGYFPVSSSTGNANTYFSDKRNITGNAAFSTHPDGLIVKLNSNLELKWSTFYGSSSKDFCSSVACNSIGDVYVTGWTEGLLGDNICNVSVANHEFPTCHLSSEYSQALINDTKQNFISRFSNDGELKWSSFWGGEGEEGEGPQLAVDFRDNVYLVGSTNSPNNSSSTSLHTVDYGSIYHEDKNRDVEYFNTYNIPDGYIACFSTWNQPIWSTYIGGVGGDACRNVATYHSSSTSSEYLYVVGETEASGYFPLNVVVASQCCQATLAGNKDAFLTQFVTSGLISIDEYDLDISQLTVFPSPVSNNLNIEFYSKSKLPSNLNVYNLLGERCISEKVNIIPGKNTFRLSTQKLQNGFYFFELANTKNKCAIKFIKHD